MDRCRLRSFFDLVEQPLDLHIAKPVDTGTFCEFGKYFVKFRVTVR
jgi:hypothetical protein